MDRLCVFVAVTALFYSFSSRNRSVSGVEVELRVQPEDNVTLHCDCRARTGVYIVWYRTCFHRNQPTLVLSTSYNARKTGYNLRNEKLLNPFPGFTLVWNQSNESFDILIVNVTESDLGLYYCGTEEKTVEDIEKIAEKKIYRYGNVTISLSFVSVPKPGLSEPVNPPDPERNLYWILLLTLCPACALLSSILSSTMVYYFCCRTIASKEPRGHLTPDSRRGESRVQEEGDLCYSALDIRQGPRRPQTTRRTRTSDVIIYSAVKTSGVSQ
ncbi:uncharacterized protein LOC124484371 isoform X2 [Hypomesus transpacificus]|uniref:uncharacterized protein LOC124484371 isoform X2 n=1 Tax=Hypomesus transpacificus TaxID=137520 RepID=UPI001F075F3E|nr:uncharacterized protein LOC124484371 isoform X2 [Hypomesus transpacificus]